MAKKITVKPEFAKEVFGFNNSGEPLGKRNDLHLLVKAAKANNYEHILDMFESVPTDEELAAIEGEEFKQKRADKTNTNPTKDSA